MQRFDPDTSVHLLSDTALEIRLEERIDPKVSDRIRQLTNYFKSHPPPGLSDIIPSYTRVVLRFDPCQMGPEDLPNLVSTLPNLLPPPGIHSLHPTRRNCIAFLPTLLWFCWPVTPATAYAFEARAFKAA